ncbi:phage tail tape measure protein [Marinibactrum halimedae]|uniref:Phage tail tape measure protein n=1 Tax=Marinibactrum halimedae TaxID=1444977 RepID=A0AA37T922_9GAMM|nr:phage tail tape measure protein [Marinibactrum halimedae]MCD9458459.1 phage tail tape measure protein [Marinibactrum halimedae]GLS26156.1 phage tail tape measure protein [Marinibactrum halimedae]
MKHLEELFFTVDLINKSTGGVNEILRDIDRIEKHTKAGMQNIAAGVTGLFSAWYALDGMMTPGRDMANAVREVSALSVNDNALAMLEKDALAFSIQFGESAVDVVRSAYDIQSAISGLQDAELTGLTITGATLAKATKADSATITDYMGTMYGIFKNQANEMGKIQWAEMLAGRTAAAVEMFKTTGSEMSAAFGGLGANAKAMGVSLSEQMAILGTLQSTMSGSESSTHFEALLAGIGRAQKELGLRLTNDNDRMLHITDVLRAIQQSQYSDLEQVSNMNSLSTAFGSDLASSTISLLIDNIDELQGSIERLDSINGMDNALVMAKKQIDPWSRFEAGVTAVSIAFSRALEPSLNPLANSLGDIANTTLRWTQLFPNLTHAIGSGTLSILGLVAAASVFSILMGLVRYTIAGVHTVMLIGKGIHIAYAWGLGLIKSAFIWMRGAALGAMLQMNLWRTSMIAGSAATWLFNAALWANPITWIVAGVLAAVAVVALLIRHWDTLTVGFKIGLAKVQDWFSNFIASIPCSDLFLDWLLFPVTFIKLLQKIPEFIMQFINWFQGLDLLSSLRSQFDGFLQLLDRLPFIDLGINATGNADVQTVLHKAENERIDANQALGLSPSGKYDQPNTNTLQNISTVMNNTTQRGVHVDKLEVNTNQKVDGNTLLDQLLMAGG